MNNKIKSYAEFLKLDVDEQAQMKARYGDWVNLLKREENKRQAKEAALNAKAEEIAKAKYQAMLEKLATEKASLWDTSTPSGQLHEKVKALEDEKARLVSEWIQSESAKLEGGSK